MGRIEEGNREHKVKLWNDTLLPLLILQQENFETYHTKLKFGLQWKLMPYKMFLVQRVLKNCREGNNYIEYVSAIIGLFIKFLTIQKKLK